MKRILNYATVSTVIPSRVDYTLTKNGDELRQAILPILQWAISKKGTVLAHCSCSMIEKGKKIDRINFAQEKLR
jgi:DNA-binding HxlR family transcriptional regulator